MIRLWLPHDMAAHQPVALPPLPAAQVDGAQGALPVRGLSTMTYTLMFTADGPSITCHACGRTSHSRSDVENLYCGFCRNFHEEPAGARDPLAMWTVTDHPKDYPNDFVARKQLIGPGGVMAWTREIITGKTLAELRTKLPPGLHCLGRQPGDDPVIVEVWL